MNKQKSNLSNINPNKDQQEKAEDYQEDNQNYDLEEDQVPFQRIKYQEGAKPFRYKKPQNSDPREKWFVNDMQATKRELERYKRQEKFNKPALLRKIIRQEQQKIDSSLGTHDLKAIVDAMKQNNEIVLKAVERIDNFTHPFKGSLTSNLGMDRREREKVEKEYYGALQQVEKEKLGGYVTKDTWADALKELDIKSDELPYRKFKEALALDDFGGLLGAASELVKVVAPPAIDLIMSIVTGKQKEKESKEKSKQAMGRLQDIKREMVVIDPRSDIPNVKIDQQRTIQNALDPYKFNTEPGVNVERLGYQKRTKSSELDLDHVDMDFLATYFACSLNQYRKPSLYPTPTSVASTNGEFEIGVNSVGNGFLYLFPWNIVNSQQLNSVSCFAGSLGVADASFVPSTGIYTGANAVIYPGALSGSPVNGTIQFYKLTAFEFTLIPIVSANNNAGSISGGFFPMPPNSTIGVNAYPQIPQSQITQLRSYKSGNALTTYRWIKPVTDADSDALILNGTTTNANMMNLNAEGFYVLLTGFTPSITAMKIIYSFVVEFQPNAQSASVTPQAYPNAGAATMSMISSLTKMFPQSTSLDISDASDMIAALRSCDDRDHNCLVNKMKEFLARFSIQKKTPLIYANSGGGNNLVAMGSNADSFSLA